MRGLPIPGRSAPTTGARVGASSPRRFACLFGVALLVAVGGMSATLGGPVHGSVVESVAARTQTGAPTVAGAWRRLPPAPIAGGSSWLSVWTGRQMLIFGRAQREPPVSVNAAAAYDPRLDTWQLLAPPAGPTGNYEGHFSAVWTGKEMLVSGPLTREAFNPATNTWRRLPRYIGPAGIVVWTGRELISWGGGCCGEASSEGTAYNPVTNTQRRLARSPLAPEQSPIGDWTGRELVVFVIGVNPADGKPWPARLARAAAYNPVTDTWRRIAPPPEQPPWPHQAGQRPFGATAVWDGRELLVVGGGPQGRSTHAYAPATNRWRRLAPVPSRREGAAIAWTGRRLLVWGGGTFRDDGSLATAPRGLAFDLKANRWSALPRAPLLGRLYPTTVWTGRELIVWGGQRPTPRVGTGQRLFADGAAFRPATP